MKNRNYIIENILMGFLALFIFAGVNSATAQCNLDVESNIEQSSNDQQSDIYLKVNKGSGSLDFYLVDLKAPDKGHLQKKTKSASELKNDFVLVFSGVEPSTYTIQVVDNNKCQISVGGLKGIAVTKN